MHISMYRRPITRRFRIVGSGIRMQYYCGTHYLRKYLFNQF